MNDEVIVEMVLSTWTKYIAQTNELLDSLSDEQLLNEIAPGRNRGSYILGHLIAIHDKMLPILGISAEAHADLFERYVKKPDGKTETPHNVAELKKIWNEQNILLNNWFKNVNANEWFEKHALVSAEDFARDKKRNRLNVLLARIPHLTYHLGQLALLKSKNS